MLHKALQPWQEQDWRKPMQVWRQHATPHTKRPRAGTNPQTLFLCLANVLTAATPRTQYCHTHHDVWKAHLRVAAPHTGGNPGSADFCWLASAKQCYFFGGVPNAYELNVWMCLTRCSLRIPLHASSWVVRTFLISLTHVVLTSVVGAC